MVISLAEGAVIHLVVVEGYSVELQLLMISLLVLVVVLVMVTVAHLLGV